MRKSTIVNVIVASIVAHGAMTYAGEYTFNENFNTLTIEDVGMPSDNTIVADTIVENLPDGTTSKVYYEHNVAGSKGKMLIKQYRLAVEPFVEGTSLYTGSSDLAVTNVSKFYQVGGMRYKLDTLCDTLDIAFEYYNVTSPNGSVALVLQQVDEAGVVVWEQYFLMAGYKSYISTWQSIHYTTDRMETLAVKGREFNVVWVMGVGHTAIDPMGGQLANVAIIAHTNYEIPVEEPVVEEVIEEPVVEEEVVIEEEVIPQPADESECDCDCECDCNKFAKQIAQANGKGHVFQSGKFTQKQARWCEQHRKTAKVKTKK